MNNNALIIYNQVDVDKNQWFINHLINCLSDKNIDAKLLTTQNIYKILGDSSDIGKLGSIPELVINRSRDYHLSELFESNNIKVFNSSFVTRIANDKDLTYKHFAGNVNYLPYELFKTEEINENNNRKIKDLADNFGYPFVLKVAEGHGGDCVFLINNQNQLTTALDEIKNKSALNEYPYYKVIIQKVARTLGKDLRVYVLGNRIVSAILRSSSDDFRSNYSLGGKTCVHNLTDIEKQVTEDVIKYLPADFYGIDFVYDDDQPILNEIEDAVGTRMLYQNTNIDIVGEYAKYIAENKKKS